MLCPQIQTQSGLMSLRQQWMETNTLIAADDTYRILQKHSDEISGFKQVP